MDNVSSGTRATNAKSTEKQLSFDSARMKDIGSRYTPDGSTTEYGRDVDRLFAQYKPLRLAIYKRVASRLYSPSDKEDLISYINEHFVRLVKEYDVTGGVDFPGYVKTLLTFRATNSFVSGLAKVYNKEDLVGFQQDVEEQLTSQGSQYSENIDETDVMEYYDEFIQFVLTKHTLSDIELTILQSMVVDERTITIARELKREYDLPQREAIDKIKEFRQVLLNYLSEFGNSIL